MISEFYSVGVLICATHMLKHTQLSMLWYEKCLERPWLFHDNQKSIGLSTKKTGPYLRTRGAFGDSLLTGWIIIRFRPISSFDKVFPWWYTGKSFELFGLKVSYFTYQNEKSFGKMVVLSFTLIWKFCYLALLLLWNFDFEH